MAIHDTFKRLLKQELLLRLAEIRGTRIVKAEELEFEAPLAAVRIDAMRFILLPLGKNVGHNVLMIVRDEYTAVAASHTMRANLVFKVLFNGPACFEKAESVDALDQTQLLLDVNNNLAASRI